MASIDSIVSRSVCGVEAVCLIKADGQALVRFVAVEVGQRRRLGVGAGATALLAALDPMQCEHVIDAIAPGLRPYPRLTPESLRATVRLTRRSGFAISQGTVVAGGFGAGLSLPAVGHTPHLALSIDRARLECDRVARARMEGRDDARGQQSFRRPAGALGARSRIEGHADPADSDERSRASMISGARHVKR